MDIRKLEIFIDLAASLNYTETAERQFTTQGNISKQILSLEKELNVKLFTRSHRKIELTHAGALSVTPVKALLANYHLFREELQEYQAEKDLSVNLYTIPTMSNYYGFDHMAHFFSLHPEITVHLEEVESNELFAFLQEGINTIIFARTFEEDLTNFASIITEQDQFVAVLPSDHPLARKKEINLQELEQAHFLVLGKDSNLFHPVVDLCQKAGFTPTITYEGARIDVIINMISCNMGVSVMMGKSMQPFLSSKIASVPIIPSKTSQLAFIRKKNNNSKASDIFWNYLKNAYK